MEIIEGLPDPERKLKNSVITIGKFDGVHIGHQRIIETVVEDAKITGGPSIVLTFHDHPGVVIDREKSLRILTTISRKVEIIRNLGVDILIVIRFDRDFALLSPREFVDTIIYKRLGAKKIVVGPDFSFGKDRSGTVEMLQKLGSEYSFEVKVVPFVTIGKTRISSTAIRNLLQEKQVETAIGMLGNAYSFVI